MRMANMIEPVTSFMHQVKCRTVKTDVGMQELEQALPNMVRIVEHPDEPIAWTVLVKTQWPFVLACWSSFSPGAAKPSICLT